MNNCKQAQKYAHAFINVFYARLDPEDIQQYQALYRFLKNNKHLLAFTIASQQQEQLLFVVNMHNSETPLSHLIALLIKNKDLMLLPIILFYIQRYYLEKKRIVSWDITTSHPLSEQQLTRVHNFLAAVTNSAIMYTVRVQPSLIVGIRAQSSHLLWEHSIARYLQCIRHTLIR